MNYLKIKFWFFSEPRNLKTRLEKNRFESEMNPSREMNEID